MSTDSSTPTHLSRDSIDGALIDGLSARRLGELNLTTDTVVPGETPLPPLTPGELAPYFPQLELISCLGRGGMGVVYKARQRSLNRLVALKLLAPERAGDPQFAARFEKEALALASLNHPHIVGVYDFGHAGGFYFLLMEFVDGVNLRQLLQTKRLSPAEALSIVPPVCEALQCAHDQGIVHRDIKPENLLIDKTGKVKIADFGIAKIIQDHHPASPPSTGEDIAAVASNPLGTPDYAAPEQHHHAAATDHRADIYSLGVVLYEMLTGERPQHDIVPPSKKVQVDIRIDEIVLRALDQKPELRFPTATEFRAQIDRLATPLPPAVPPASDPTVRFLRFLAIVAIVIYLLLHGPQIVSLHPVMLLYVLCMIISLGVWWGLRQVAQRRISTVPPGPPARKATHLPVKAIGGGLVLLLVVSGFIPLAYLGSKWGTRDQRAPRLQPELISTQKRESMMKAHRQTMRSIQEKISAFHQGEPDNQAVIKVVYFHALDREPLAGYQQRTERLLSDISSFYSQGLAEFGVFSNGLPFERDAEGRIKLRMVRGQHPASHYNYQSGDNTWSEVTTALDEDIVPAKDHVLILYGLCDKARDGRYIFSAPYYGAAWSDQRHGLCHAADGDLLDPLLLNNTEQPIVFTEHYYARQEMNVAKFNSWYIGGIAHELGHALGLPHDSGSPDEAARGTSLMGAGNLHYREDLHGGTRPAFLSLASAIRIAAHPLITRSNKARWQDIWLGPCNVTATTSDHTLGLAGKVSASIPACAVIATVWPASAEEGQDHSAMTLCSDVDSAGRFHIELTPLPAGEWNLKLGAVLANGAEPRIRTTFSVDTQGRPQADDLTMKLQVDLVEQLLMQRPTDAMEFLSDDAIASAGSDEARRRLKLLQRMTQPEPELIDLTTTSATRASLSDARWIKAEVGWGQVARNRYDAHDGVWQGLLLKLAGKVYDKGLYAHAKSVFAFSLAGRWNTFSSTVGLRDGSPGMGSAVFVIEGDGIELARSRFLRPGMSELLKTDVTGVNTLTLRAEGSEGHNHGSWSIWCDPLLERAQKSPSPLLQQ